MSNLETHEESAFLLMDFKDEMSLIRSLFQLLQFNAALFITVMVELEDALINVAHGGDSETFKSKSMDTLKILEEQCEKAGLTSCKEQIYRIRTRFSNTVTPTLIALVSCIRGHIQDEFIKRKCFIIDPVEQRFYDGSFIPSEIHDKFPSAIFDLSEAGKCIVFRRATASICHSMRALEVGLDALKTALKVKPKNPNWETILDDCQQAIGNLPKADRHFYTQCAIEFRNFQHAWRNYVMHFQKDKPTYKVVEASNVLQGVIRFYDGIYPRLSESP